MLFDIVLRVLLKVLRPPGSGSGTSWRSFFRDRGRQNQVFCFFVLRLKLTILLGPPMQNGHFYFCTPDIVGIRFFKSGDFAWDILTIFQNTLHVMFFVKSSRFSVLTTPPMQNGNFFLKIMIFLRLPKLRKWPIVDRGLRF